MNEEDDSMNNKDIFEYIHTEIHREHDLISNRMSWYATSQSFLLTAFAITGSQNHNYQWLGEYLLPLLGISTTIVIIVAIMAAISSMCSLRRNEKQLLETEELAKLNSLQNKLPHIYGIMAPIAIPLLFLFAWLIICIKVLMC